MSYSNLSKWISDKFGDIEVKTLSSLSVCIYGTYSIDIEMSSEGMRLVSDRDLNLPVIGPKEGIGCEEIAGFRVKGATELRNIDILFDMSDVSKSSLFIQRGAKHTYPDSGVGVIVNADISLAIFIAWYLSIDEVSTHINNEDDVIKALEMLPVPFSDKLIHSKFVNAIKSSMDEEVRLIINVEEMISRVKGIRLDLIDEVHYYLEHDCHSNTDSF